MDRLLSNRAHGIIVGTWIVSLAALGCSEAPDGQMRPPAEFVSPIAAAHTMPARHVDASPETGVVTVAHLFAPPPVPEASRNDNIVANSVDAPIVRMLAPVPVNADQTRTASRDIRRLPVVLASVTPRRPVFFESPQPLSNPSVPNGKQEAGVPAFQAPANEVAVDRNLRTDDQPSVESFRPGDELAPPAMCDWPAEPPKVCSDSPMSSQVMGKGIRRLPPAPFAVSDSDIDTNQLSPLPRPSRELSRRDSPAPRPACSNEWNHRLASPMVSPPGLSVPEHDPGRTSISLEQVGRPEDPIDQELALTGPAPSWQPVEIPMRSLTESMPPSPTLDEQTAAVVERQVMTICSQAEELASRGAYFAARAEIIKSLRLVTQTLDADQSVRSYGQALAAAMRSLKEAEEFSPNGSTLEADIDLSRLVESHRTPALKHEKLDRLTPLAAQQRYLTFAQEQLARASGGLPAASISLFNLGKIYMAMGDAARDSGSLNLPKAVALHQAALMVDARNLPAANELGVLLARSGQLVDARAVLLHGIMIRPCPETWHNLAVVHDRLGEHRLAQRAEQQARLADTRGGQQAAGSRSSAVRWVDAREFSASAPSSQIYQ